MAEDPRFLLHFKTLEKFEAEKANGTISENRHLCFIKTPKLIWCRGVFYTDGLKLDGIDSFYNDWELVQTNANKVVITLKGQLWDETTRAWKSISKTIDLLSATQSFAGLLSATDKKAIDNLHAMSWSHIDDTNTFTATTADVNLNYTCKSTTSDSSDDPTSHSQPIGAASSSRAGVMIAQDKIELDRINTTNFELTTPTHNTSNVVLNSSRLNINTNATDTSNSLTINSATASTAGVMTADNYNQIYTTLPNAINQEVNDRTAAINALDATVRSQLDDSDNITTGNHVGIKVVETDGKLTSALIKETDIASAATLKSHTDNTTIHITADERTSWTGKQNAISDLDTIRSNASNGNTAYGWGNHANAGYVKSSGVTSISAGTGLTTNLTNGGAITSTGTVKAKLRSETALTRDSAAATETENRVYPVAVDKSGYLAVNVPWTDNNTTYNNATQSAAGLMSKEDKIKLDNIKIWIGTTAEYTAIATKDNGTLYFVKA